MRVCVRVCVRELTTILRTRLSNNKVVHLHQLLDSRVCVCACISCWTPHTLKQITLKGRESTGFMYIHRVQVFHQSHTSSLHTSSLPPVTHTKSSHIRSSTCHTHTHTTKSAHQVYHLSHTSSLPHTSSLNTSGLPPVTHTHY